MGELWVQFWDACGEGSFDFKEYRLLEQRFPNLGEVIKDLKAPIEKGFTGVRLHPCSR